MGVNNTAATISSLATRAATYTAVLHVGDVSYADDTDVKIEASSGREYEAVYDLFQQTIEPITSTVPYMVTPGNHDITCRVTSDFHCPELQRNYTAFRHRWRMPSIESLSAATEHHNVYYSFDVGPVHFVSINTESDFPGAPTTPHTKIGGGAGGPFGDQLSWLETDLRKAQSDAGVKFIVALGHRPWITTSISDWPLLAPLHVKNAFEGLFQVSH